MKALRITRCSDLLMWYAPLVGQVVPYLGEFVKLLVAIFDCPIWNKPSLFRG